MKRRSLIVILLGFLLNALLILGVLGSGTVAGFVYGLFLRWRDELPRLEVLAEYQPSLITTVYSRDNEVLGRFFLEKRVFVPLSEIPQDLKDAVFAIEDSRFYEHKGIDVKGVLRAFVANVKARRIVEGASTITQQLVRTMFLSRERVYTRKLKEMLLAWKLEQLFNKDQILEMYFNEIYLGNGAYGVEAASRTYFGKSAKDLSLGECVLLAGLPKAPENYNPKRHLSRAKKRQKTVLDRMVKNGFIDKETAEAAYEEPLQLRRSTEENESGLYFVEVVRQRLEKQLGSEAVHRGGLHIYTTLDLKFQKAAEKALRDGLRTYDKRHGYRGPLSPGARVVELASTIAPGARLLAEVRKVKAKGIEVDLLTAEYGKRPDIDIPTEEVYRRPGFIASSSLSWIDGKASELFQENDLILVEVKKVPEKSGAVQLELEQEPEAEAALLCLDPFRGEVLAMVGGYDFEKSEFNRALQARRQPGSAFKNVIYMTALEQLLTPATVVYDTAVVEEKTNPTSEDDKLWRPRNYTGTFSGKTTLRTAFAKSLNPVAVNLIRDLGIKAVIRTARRLGITASLAHDLSLGLGSSGVSLLEMTASYGVFAAGGLLTRPYFIRRIELADGEIVDEQAPEVRQVIAPEFAYVLTRLLEGVVQGGTAWRARRLGRAVAGKTGTTNDFRDAWFLGYSPDIAAGVWVGFDDMQRGLGQGEAGGKVALPIWVDFMEEALQEFEARPFPAPHRIVRARIDPESGLLATPQCRKIILETFVSGTVPTRYCEQHAVSVSDFDQLDSLSESDLMVVPVAAEPVIVTDPSEPAGAETTAGAADDEDH